MHIIYSPDFHLRESIEHETGPGSLKFEVQLELPGG
jgi:hypothetical protein